MASVRESIVAYARSVIGCRYSYVPSGGVEGESYNCSFLTTCAYRHAGISIPRWQGHQNGDGSQSDWVWRNGHWTTDPAKLQPGDLVFFGSSRTYTTHVGISLGGRWMIDSVPAGGVQQRLLYASFVGGGWPLDELPASDEGRMSMAQTVEFTTRTNVRDKPSLKGNIVARYAAGDTVTLDAAKLAEGIVWGHYVGASSHKDRWVCISQENVK